MDQTEKVQYERARSGGAAYYQERRGLIAVRGSEAPQFLDGLVSNDVKKLEDGMQMLAAFPSAQGRLIAIARVLRQGDHYLFETEDATRARVHDTLAKFTAAGDFFVEDLSDSHSLIRVYHRVFVPITPPFIEFDTPSGTDYFVHNDDASDFLAELAYFDAQAISDAVHEVLRIEAGTPKYGVDMDEMTIVPEIGLDGMISYEKGCYIGQEIIARIHFRGHVAKALTGLALSGLAEPGTDLTRADGKNAGRITSVVFSPALEEWIALGYVRYEHLAEGTELAAGQIAAKVRSLPFV